MPWTRRAGSNRKDIVHIVVTGYQKKKEPRKHYVFVIDVTWNNSERYETYRRYSDFFSFQTTLKALFPAAAGKRKEERSIPQLPKRIFVGRSHVARVAEARLEQINRYCQTLISLDPRISESAHVIGFFSPRIGDKQLPKLHLHRPTSIHPKNIPVSGAFEEYCALAEYVAEDSSQVSFKAGDKVVVMSKDDSGWWMCGVGGKVGWAPPSYLKKCTAEKPDTEGESDDSDDELFMANSDTFMQSGKESDDSGVGDNTPTTPKSGMEESGFHVPEIMAEEYKAIENYKADGPGQVSFEEGDIIHVLDKLEDGWWFVSVGAEEGWAPCSYLERLNGKEEEETISSLDIEKYYSVDDYEAEEEDEISFPKGAVVDVLQKRLDGWWFVKHEDRTGLAPATFLRKGQPPANPDLPVISEVKENKSSTSSLQVPNADSDTDDELSYENITFGVPHVQRAQPPRRQSVRQQASLRKSGKSNKSGGSPSHPKISKPALPNIPTRPFDQRGKSATPFAEYLNYQPPDSERQSRGKSEPFPDYLNYQPPASPGSSDSEQGRDEPCPDYLNYQPPPLSSDSDQENTVSKNRKKLGTLKEEDEGDMESSGHGSMRALLKGRGDVRNRIKAFEKGGSGSETSSLSSNQSEESIKNVASPSRQNPRPPIAVPRTRIRNQPPPIAQAKSMDNSPPPRPPHPRLKSRSKSVEASSVTLPSARPPPPSKPSPMHIASSSSPKKIPVINEELVDDKPPPPPVGPNHPLRPNGRNEEEKPVQPPRPSLSVYKRAKDRSRSASPQMHKRIVRPPNAGEREDSDDSDTASSVYSYKSTSTTSSGRPQQKYKVKKVRSQSSVEQPSQDLLTTKKPIIPPSRRKSASESTDSALFPPLEAPPKNTMGEAIGEGEEASLSDNMAGSILKYILSSPDPKLKEALKDLLKNDSGVMNSIQGDCK